MKNFIKLTCNADSNSQYTWINVSNIVRIEEFYSKHTKLWFTDGTSMWVVESPAEVMEKIGA